MISWPKTEWLTCHIPGTGGKEGEERNHSLPYKGGGKKGSAFDRKGMDSRCEKEEGARRLERKGKKRKTGTEAAHSAVA